MSQFLKPMSVAHTVPFRTLGPKRLRYYISIRRRRVGGSIDIRCRRGVICLMVAEPVSAPEEGREGIYEFMGCVDTAWGTANDPRVQKAGAELCLPRREGGVRPQSQPILEERVGEPGATGEHPIHACPALVSDDRWSDPPVPEHPDMVRQTKALAPRPQMRKPKTTRGR
jgi:hypothetical protein